MSTPIKMLALSACAFFGLGVMNAQTANASAAASQECCGNAACQQGVGNPYLPLWEHLPDGEPRVFEDPDNPGKLRAYIIGSHDLSYDRYCGADIRMWSAPVDNLLDWRDEGPIFTYEKDGRWDIMYAPDLVEVKENGKKVYYLYPHSRGPRREPMVCRGERPDGPFTPVNLTEDGRGVKSGSIFGFDPSVFVDEITDKRDPDYATGFRAYGFWGFQRSSAAELDPKTMWSARPGTEVVPYFIPACTPDGKVRDPEGTTYPALHKDQKPEEFGFFEASSIRKVGNKYVMIFSGYSGKEYGLGNSNSTLRYAFGDSPLGPWRSGGVLVDSRGVVPNENGTRLTTTNAGHNTHGSLQQINGQWYVFYHRPPRGFGFARQAMVAPVTIQWDKKSVADGGRVVIRGYDPYAKNGQWTAKASDGTEYTGAEVTSEGFQIFGMDPYKYYSAGFACYLSNGGAMQDNWDVWDDNMPVLMTGGDIVGFKYFGFGGLKKAQLGLAAFEGAKPGNQTHINVSLTPQTNDAQTLRIMLDGPWDNATWRGREIARLQIPAGKQGERLMLTADVSAAVEKLSGKHGVYLVLDGARSDWKLTLHGLGFARGAEPMALPEVPTLRITLNGKDVDLPLLPMRFSEENGLTDNAHYMVSVPVQGGMARVEATASKPCVKVEVDAPRGRRQATVRATYHGQTKTYIIQFI